ncbi:MAG: DUF2807 domain-containing protein [Spirochaetia bacterium]|jgi:hypothetical protein
MKKTLKRTALLPCAALAMLLAGCALLPPVTGSGTLTRSTYPAAGFSGIQASQSFQVRVIPDPVYSVIITCDTNLVRYLIVQKSGTGTLRLSLVPGYNYFGVTLIAEIHMPAVALIDASGASTVRLDAGFASAQSLSVVLSGASVCELSSVAFGDMSFDVSGASQVTCTGSAAAITLNVSGASRANVLNCSGTRATVSLSGASEGWVDIGARPLDLSASGASTLYYGSSPALVARELSGGSRIVRVR